MLTDYLKNKFFSEYDKGTMVEVGAAGPVFLSQSKPFRDLGWRCICVEPNPNFAQMHRDAGNEIYEYACSNEDKDDIDFEMVYMPGDGVTYESFSSLGVSQDLSIASGFHSGKDSIPVNTIKVNCRKLDTILDLANADKVDYLIVDVEGWELNVMRGFSTLKYRPRVIVLENGIPSTHQSYHDFMNNIGYTFDSFDETTGPNLVYYNYNF